MLVLAHNAREHSLTIPVKPFNKKSNQFLLSRDRRKKKPRRLVVGGKMKKMKIPLKINVNDLVTPIRIFFFFFQFEH